VTKRLFAGDARAHFKNGNYHVSILKIFIASPEKTFFKSTISNQRGLHVMKNNFRQMSNYPVVLPRLIDNYGFENP
jgi:hypothetical protein